MRIHEIGLALAGAFALGGAQAEPAREPPRSPEGRHYLSQPCDENLHRRSIGARLQRQDLRLSQPRLRTNIPDDDLGTEYAMHDYRVLRINRIGGPVTVGPVALDVKQVPWASKQMWAPDAAYKNGTYFSISPRAITTKASLQDRRRHVEDANGPVQGRAAADQREVFDRSRRCSPMATGAAICISGASGVANRTLGRRHLRSQGQQTPICIRFAPALSAKVARMTPDMKQFAEKPRDVLILGADGKPLTGGEHDKRFFEASWMFKRGQQYYFTYSTGDTHFLAYATGETPYGPFHYRGHILLPVQGWTTHHSIVQADGRWWLFYADTRSPTKTTCATSR